MKPELFLQQRKKGMEKDIYPLNAKKIEEIITRIPYSARKEARKVWLTRIGKTFEEIQNEQIEDYKKLLLPFLSPKDLVLANKCVFGILPQQVDFFAESEWKFSDGKCYVGLNDGLCHVISIFCHMYAKSSLIGKFDMLTKWMPFVARYLYSLQKRKPMNNLLPTDIYPQSEFNYRYSEILTCACIHFIMGHELGHIENEDEEIKGCRKLSYDMEFKADQKGARLCYEISQKDEFRKDQYLLAPLLSLCFLKIWENENSSTHPPVDQRLDRIIKFYENELNLTGAYFDSILKDIYRLQYYFQDMKEEIACQKKRLESIQNTHKAKLFE